jgi:hypothetical protein
VQVLLHKWHCTSTVMSYTFSAQMASEFVLEPAAGPARDVGSPGGKHLQRSAAVYAAVPRSSFIITGGHWDSAVRVINAESGAVKQSASGHHGCVTSLALAHSAPL